MARMQRRNRLCALRGAPEMSDPIQACAELVAKGDPDRFKATMAAPLEARTRLLPLYALNLEIARAPWLTEEPMIAEMRLQFWRDTVEEAALGKPARAHEVAQPLAALIQTCKLPVDVLDAMIAARRWDIYKNAHEDAQAFEAYLDDTGGGLMWCAAIALGAAPMMEDPVRKMGQATALAGLFQAVPDLEARGRVPLVDGRPQAVADLARDGLTRIQAARSARLPKSLWPALWAGAHAATTLKQVAQDPMRVANATLMQSDLRKSLRLLRFGTLGGY